MRARQAKKLLRALVSGQVRVLAVPRDAGAVVLRYPRAWPEDVVEQGARWISEALGVPVVPLPEGTDLSAVRLLTGEDGSLCAFPSGEG